MKTPEWYEKRELDEFLKELGPEICYFIKPTTKGFGESGTPDRCASICGVFWGFELKRPGKDATPVQQKRIDAILKTGGGAIAGTADYCISFVKAWLSAYEIT